MNPFVQADPVALLAWIGYALTLVGIAVGCGRAALEWVRRVRVRRERNHTADEWWGGWVPPRFEAGLLAATFGVMTVAFWAASAIVWIASGRGGGHRMNPFIYVAQDPVAALSSAGHLSLVVLLMLGGAYLSFRIFTLVYFAWKQERHTSKWWGGWMPPLKESGLLIVGVLSVAGSAWATGAVIRLLA